MMDMPAPIVLFGYNRPDHLKRTVETLRRNDLAPESSLMLYLDGPKANGDETSVKAVRRYAETVDGFGDVRIISREVNMGLAGSIIAGVTEMVENHGRCIVLEDDLVTSPYFLRFMNDGLRVYEREDDVVSIHGYVYPVDRILPDTFFLKGADCWGWATWKRGWDVFSADAAMLYDRIVSSGLEREFTFNGSSDYLGMLGKQRDGLIDSWAVCWYASALIAGKLTLYPGRTLVRNIGADDSGTHRGSDCEFDGIISPEPVTVEFETPRENQAARSAFERYFRKTKRKATVQRLKRLLGWNR